MIEIDRAGVKHRPSSEAQGWGEGLWDRAAKTGLSARLTMAVDCVLICGPRFRVAMQALLSMWLRRRFPPLLPDAPRALALGVSVKANSFLAFGVAKKIHHWERSEVIVLRKLAPGPQQRPASMVTWSKT
jgi:hypothetical protein